MKNGNFQVDIYFILKKADTELNHEILWLFFGFYTSNDAKIV